MTLLKKLASETVYYGVSSILSRLLNYVIVTPYLTRVFSKGEYGVVSEMYTYIAILAVLFTYRMETAYFRYANDKKLTINVFSTSSLAIFSSTILFSACLILAATPIASWLGYPDHSNYVRWFSLILATDALTAIPFASLRLANRPKFFAFSKTIGIVVNIIFLFFFLEVCPSLIAKGYEWAGFYDPSDRVAYIFIANLLGSLATLVLLLPHQKEMMPKLVFDATLLRKMIFYAAPLVVAGLAAIVNQLIGIPLLKYLLPYGQAENTAQMGIYGACYKIAILMSLFTQAFNYAAEPFFFRNAARDDSRRIYAQVSQAFALVGSLVFLGIMLHINLVQHFIGEQFREGLNVVPVLLMAFVFLGLYYNFSVWYKLSDKTHFGAFISIIGSIITIIFNFLLIPKIGYMGAAWATFACYGTMALLAYVSGQRYFPIDYATKTMLAYMVGAAAVLMFSNLVVTPHITNVWLAQAAQSILFIMFALVSILSAKRSGLFS